MKLNNVYLLTYDNHRTTPEHYIFAKCEDAEKKGMEIIRRDFEDEIRDFENESKENVSKTGYFVSGDDYLYLEEKSLL